MSKSTKQQKDSMENGYAALISDTKIEIKKIRQRAHSEILEKQKLALAQTERDFSLLGWKKWSTEDLTKEGQFERLEQSVTDTQLKIVLFYEQAQIATIDEPTGSYKVTGEKCECADFIFNGLPCKHMYFLAGVLMKRMEEDTKN